MSIFKTTLAYDRMAAQWALPIALWGDTEAMRAAGETFTPSRKGEKTNGVLNDNYDTRVNETTLTNYFTPTIKNLSGKVFQKPVVIGEALTAKEDWWDNVDLQGSNLNEFVKELFESAARYGMSFILVDSPAATVESETLEQQRARNVRPYFTHITADQVIGIKTEEINNLTTLTEVRILETIIEEDDEYSQTEVKQVRKIYKNFGEGSEAQGCTYEIWQAIDGNEVIVKQGRISLDSIPLVACYTNRTGFMEAQTYFTTLCNLNLAHWQSSSYQRNILNVARVPRLGAYGFSEEEIKEFQKHGVSKGIFSTNPDANASWTEAKGDSISSGERDLASLEAQMELRSLDPVLKQANATDVATIANIEQSKSNSVLQSWAANCERTVEKAIELMYQLASEDVAVEITINDDFNIVSDVDKKAKQLLEDYVAATMSLATLLKERKRIGYLDDDFDIDAELERLTADSGLTDFGDGPE